MNNFTQMPMPPTGSYQQTAYDMYGNPIQAQTFPPQQQFFQQQPQYYQPTPVMEPAQQPEYSGLGANFSGLINTNVQVPIERELPKKQTRTRKKKSDTETNEVVTASQSNEPVSPVETVVYEDTYEHTTGLLRGTVAQIDQLAVEMKQELDKIRSMNSMKGKYTYIPAVAGVISGLMGQKIMAVREMNNSIKAVNEAEYRRFKDQRASMQTDDNKAIFDMYNAFISTPRGAIPGIPEYHQPSTIDLTSGINMVRVDAATPEARDAGFQGFLGSLSPEQNMMINENNPNIEEVIVYDQATGKKYFEWRNMATGQTIPNMPASDPMFMEDYVIDPRTRIAKNSNLHTTKKVVYENEGGFIQGY